MYYEYFNSLVNINQFSDLTDLFAMAEGGAMSAHHTAPFWYIETYSDIPNGEGLYDVSASTSDEQMREWQGKKFKQVEGRKTFDTSDDLFEMLR